MSKNDSVQVNDEDAFDLFEEAEGQVDWSLHTTTIQCPFCWQSSDIVIDPSVPQQSYVEDCFVCCRPMVLAIEIDEMTGIKVDVSAGNE